MALLVINLSRVDQQVAVISETGAKTSVRIMDRSRVHLPDGYQVDPRWKALNSNVIRVIDETPPVQTAQPAPVQPVESPVATEVVAPAEKNKAETPVVTAENSGGTTQ